MSRLIDQKIFEVEREIGKLNTDDGALFALLIPSCIDKVTVLLLDAQNINPNDGYLKGSSKILELVKKTYTSPELDTQTKSEKEFDLRTAKQALQKIIGYIQVAIVHLPPSQ